MISIKIKNPLFTYYSRFVNLLDFSPKKLSIEKVHAINDELERIYYVKYDKDPFYLIINDLKGYFCSHGMSTKTNSIHNLCIGYNNDNAYRINFVFMSKNDALNLIKIAVIIDKKGTL